MSLFQHSIGVDPSVIPVSLFGWSGFEAKDRGRLGQACGSGSIGNDAGGKKEVIDFMIATGISSGWDVFLSICIKEAEGGRS